MAEIRDNEGYRRFRVALQDGRLEAGMTVTQNELCDLLGLSLSPLRETLVLLEEFGLVDIKPRTGIRIVYPEVAFIRENYQFRVLIETAAIRAFATSVTKAWLDEMRARHAQSRLEMEDPQLPDDVQSRFLSLDLDMHRAFVEVLDNRAILHTHGRLQDNIGMARRVHRRLYFRKQLIDTIDEHLKILDSLEARDVDSAVANLEAHFRASTYRTFAAS
jgi:GntR family transcriptional regulator, rspAB operon transcriptional repressor